MRRGCADGMDVVLEHDCVFLHEVQVTRVDTEELACSHAKNELSPDVQIGALPFGEELQAPVF